ncbi:hypothetical protein SEVIR_2G018800v4 [Setaria viridis]|nr:uncharacterized protein LOC117842742 [Setaria viridis]
MASSSMAAPLPRSPPALMDELVEEILLRVPPDDPARLVHAALTCKRWCRLVSDPGFRRRFRLFHRAGPMLGFVYRGTCTTGFTPTSSFRPPGAAVCRDWWPLDARHGRILFRDAVLIQAGKDIGLIVLDPIAGEVRRLPLPWFTRSYRSWNAALLCAAAGCDHLDCAPGGPFIVIFVGTDAATGFTSVLVYSSEAAKWRLTALIEGTSYDMIHGGSTLVGNALYYQEQIRGILEYDLGKKKLSFIKLPPKYCRRPSMIVLMAAKGGVGLGFATLEDFDLYMWSRDESVPSGWTQQRVIKLRSLLNAPALSFSRYMMIALADGVGVVFILARDLGVFAVGLESGQVRKVSDDGDRIIDVFPYVSFCTPALRAASSLLHR